MLILAAAAIPDAAPAGDRSGRLVLRVDGLPPGQHAQVKVRGPSGTRHMRSQRLTLANAKPGRYVVTVRRVRITRGWRTVRRGARAFPRARRIVAVIRPNERVEVAVPYGTIVNPGVSRLPRGLLSVTGDASGPQQLLFRAGSRMPRRGHIVTAGPSAKLPTGLVARVTAVGRLGRRRILAVRPTSIGAAVPEFHFDGALPLTQATGANSARPAAAECNGPRDFDFTAKLDEFNLRRATSDLWPPQMGFTLAIRTTESVGPRLAVAGVKCSWKIAELGPWHGAIPTPIGIPIPVYATIPVTGSVNVEGSLSAFKLNLASTSVVNLDLGRTNNFSFWQEGSNVWIDGVLRFSGRATASAMLTLEVGVGQSKAGNLHLRAGFGPKVSWISGAGCDVDLALGSLSAGAQIGPLKAETPAYSPFNIDLWHGCEGADAPSNGGGPGGGSTGSEGGSPPQTSVPTSPPSRSTWPEQQGSRGANTFLNPYNASGMGLKIQPWLWVDVSCKVYAPLIQSANPDGYWYRIASAPWSNNYYAVANTFWNGDVPGQTPYTHFTDWAVPNC
jgi:hypothetical protein